MIFFVVLLILTFLAQIVEIFLPPLDWMYNAHIYIVPIIVFYGAMSLPFPLMLSLAFSPGSCSTRSRCRCSGRELKFHSDGQYSSTPCWRPLCMASGLCLSAGVGKFIAS